MWGGVNAKVIGKFDDVVNKRREFTEKVKGLKYSDLINMLWAEFDERK